jgi:hypothetical protein
MDDWKIPDIVVFGIKGITGLSIKKKKVSLEEVINIKPNMVIRIPSTTASLVIKGVDFRSLFFVCIVLRSKSYISLLLTEPIF